MLEGTEEGGSRGLRSLFPEGEASRGGKGNAGKPWPFEAILFEWKSKMNPEGIKPAVRDK